MASSRSSVLSTAPADAAVGHEEPRLFTPPLRPLTPKTSLGFALIDFARDVLGVELLPWQQWLAKHALELLPDGSFRFRTVLLLVGRQNGKSTFLQVLALFFLYVRGVPLVIGTAQNLDIAEEVWAGAVEMAEGVPELEAEIERVVQVNGKKALELRQGERYKVQAANRRGGRGLSGDLVMLDELREHQKWDAWGAVTKTTIARAHAQVWAVSNAGDKTSVVLAFLRGLAHSALGDPDGAADDVDVALPDDVEAVEDDSLAIFEWSAPPGCLLTDRQGWAAANPSLGHTITERAIRGALRTDPEPVFRTEVLCQWVERVRPSALDVDRWLTLADPKAERGAGAVFGVDLDEARTGEIAVAWRRPDGQAQIMLTEDQALPVPALTERLTELARRWDGTVALGGPAADLQTPLVAAGVPTVVLSSSDFASASGGLNDAVQAGTVHHGNQPRLNDAVKAAVWRSAGTAGERAFQLKNAPGVSPLAAAARALHAFTHRPPVDVEETIW